METLANLESFVRSAETGSFSTTARLLSLTPAAVSRNIASWSAISGPAVSPQHAQAHADRRRRTFPACDPGHLEGLQASIADIATDLGERQVRSSQHG